MLIVACINCKTSILNDKEVFVGHESETLLNRFLDNKVDFSIILKLSSRKLIGTSPCQTPHLLEAIHKIKLRPPILQITRPHSTI